MNAFQVEPFRLTFQALDPVMLAPGSMTNTFRGALGQTLFRTHCRENGRCEGRCLHHDVCLYGQLFQPQRADGPSGFADTPRPFVLRDTFGRQGVMEPGETVELDLHFFDTRAPALEHFVHAFRQLATTGFGTGRGRLELLGTTRLNNNVQPDEHLKGGLSLPLTPTGGAVTHCRLQFVTPVELKHAGTVVHEPHFHVLFARARDRVASLMSFYQSGAPDLPFKELGEQARRVRLVRVSGHLKKRSRRSSRGQHHSVSGFVGEAEYEGELTALLPIVRAAWWTGVGRQTVWGYGAVKVKDPTPIADN